MGLNVWTVLWQSPDGKPFIYKTSPASSPIRIKPRWFDVSEVQQYQAMVHRHLPDAKFRCLSNVEIPGVEVVPLETDLIAWWAKVEMFRPGLPGGRNLYFDLDTLLLKGINAIANFPAPFALIPGMTSMERAGGEPWLDQEGKYRYPRYQTSCMVWDTSEAKPIWEKFQRMKEEALEHFASDQDFLGREFPKLALMPREWFAKLRYVKSKPEPETRVVLTMMAHNDGAAREHKWARQAWG